jgi:hypothetical protein
MTFVPVDEEEVFMECAGILEVVDNTKEFRSQCNYPPFVLLSFFVFLSFVSTVAVSCWGVSDFVPETAERFNLVSVVSAS